MSNNLDRTLITSAQLSKEVSSNDADGELDAAITVKDDFSITSSNARTLTNDEFRRNVLFHITDDASTPTAAITLTVPAISRGIFAVLNLSSFAVTVTIAAQSVTAPVIATGATTPSLLTCDGVDVRATI